MLKVIKQLKCIYGMINLLRVIMSMLSKNLTEQLNNLNQHTPLDVISQSDYEIINRFLTMYSSQFESIIKKHCGTIFESTCGGKKTIQIKLNCGKTLDLCIIDNIYIEITLDVSGNNMTIKICIGDLTINLEYLTEIQTYGEAQTATVINIDNIDQVVNALVNNQNVISECFEIVKKFLKCKLV
jgi:hypothetical protein